jgi:acyl-CoA synthetase (NDP forming)/RimJ/RimL family protein N-acetyltransferase
VSGNPAELSRDPADLSRNPSDGSHYPVEWEADVVLIDGTTAHVRPVRPADRDGMARFHEGQSRESIYFRYFAPVPQLPDETLRRFTQVDHRDRVSLVATIGGEIVGIAAYDRIEGSTAEAAFSVSDTHHQRGLASVLLEHLAAAARENDVHRFVAEVLPQNRRMLGVLRDVGWELDRRFEDGVISLSFPIDPTEKSLAVMESREHRTEAVSMRALLTPESVVVIGASRRVGTIGHRILEILLSGGFTGDLRVVHPEADQVLGVPAYHRVADVPGHVDLAVVAVPSEGVLEVVTDCAGKGVRGLVVISGGFAEEDAGGLARQRELVRLARENGMRVVGPNSWGLINADPAVRLNLSLLSESPAPGRLGVFTQSAAGSVLAMDAVARRGLGVSTFVSTGNRADVSGNDCLQYWEEDEATDVVGMYLESIGNPRKFSRIARRMSRLKPIIVITSDQAGVHAPPGHAVRDTRAPHGALDALLAQSGCLRVETVHEFLDVADLLVNQPLPQGPRVAIVANTRGLGAALVDACTSSALDPLPPVILPTVASPEEIRAVIGTACGAADVDAVLAAFVPSPAAPAQGLADALDDGARGSGRPMVACFLGMPQPHGGTRGHGAVPVYRSPEDAVRALCLVTGYRAWRDRDPGARADPDGVDRAGARALVDEVLDGSPDGPTLTAEQTGRLLGHYGIRLWPAIPVTGPADAVEAAERLGWPVALKTTDPHLRHRIDLGGVQLGIGGPGELADHVAVMQRALASYDAGALVVQSMAPTGVACLVRTVEDPLFGPVISFGVAGDASDLLGDLAHRIPPLTDLDVVDLVTSVRAAPKLFGHRGAPPVRVDALYDVIARVAALADDLPEIAELELNPVVVSEESAAVLGASVRLAADPHRSDAGIRELSRS